MIGGERQAVQRVVERLGCHFLPLPDTATMHCPIAGVVADAYRELHRLPTTPPAGVRFYSAALGRAYELSQDSAAEALLAQALDTVDFPALIESAYADGVRLFVEIGPGASCSRMIPAILGDRPHRARSACPAGTDAVSGRAAPAGHASRPNGCRLHLETLYDAVAGANRPAGGTKRFSVSLGTPASLCHFQTRRQGDKETRRQGERRAAGCVSCSGGRGGDGPGSGADRCRRGGSQPGPCNLSPLCGGRPAKPGPEPGVSNRTAGGIGSTRGRNRTGRYRDARQRPCLLVSLSPCLLVALSPRIRKLDRRQCLEFAIGSMGRVLGSDYSAIDALPTRVRLPDAPLMLVDRILAIEGEPLSLTSGRVVTEHDIHPEAWYLDGGRIPTCIAVEAGQADLFLAGFLGIDLRTRGLAVYRLLDAVVTFHCGLPVAGQTIRYDIRIERFFQQGDTYLFRFRFEGTVDGQPLLTMTEGCAGFFSEAALAAGKGVVQTELARRPLQGVQPDDEADSCRAPAGRVLPDRADRCPARNGDLAGAFGPLFAGLPLRDPVRLPAGRMRLVDRVTHLDPAGGRFGIGLIRAEARIHPDDWFLTCHFVDDQVMPGTLMYECCLHTLRIFLFRLGWVGEQTEVVCEPVPGVKSQLKCRGQVMARTRTVTYEVTLKERGYRPEPYALADALMYADGKPIVEILNMSLRLTGLTRERLQQVGEPGA